MFSIEDDKKPQVLSVEKDFLLVYKHPYIHSAPLAGSGGETILEWCSAQFPEIAGLPGRKEGEGGLLYRMDYETQGLMLLARSVAGMEALLKQQIDGKIHKEYNALAVKSCTRLPGFTESPVKICAEKIPCPETCLQSAFRPYGPGRKAVRPVLPEKPEGETPGKVYTTEILETEIFNKEPVSASENSSFVSFRLGIKKGFRHQIRAHLAWLGYPILNDKLYGGSSYGNGLLALRSCSISFIDPSSGEERFYSIPRLDQQQMDQRQNYL